MIYYNIEPGVEKYFFFLLKKIIHSGDEAEIPKLVGDGMRFDFSSPLYIGRVTGKDFV